MRLDICWYPRLADLPHLFPRTDCGAGDDILVITADRAVQACSFADHRVPFETFAQLQTIYRLMRAARPVANVGGCTRELFAIDTRRNASGRVLEGNGVWTWHARASSNSGAYTILARFRSEDRAREAEAALDDAYQAHLDYVVTEEGQARDLYAPTAPLQALATQYGFTWPADDGFAWEGDAFGDREEADALEIERLGKHLIVHLAYGQSLGAGGIAQLCTALGADLFLGGEEPFHFIVTATTSKAAAEAQRAIGDLDVELDDDDATYGIDCIDSEGSCESLRFPATIGGVNDAAKVLLALARVKGLTFELRTGAPPVPEDVAADDDDDDGDDDDDDDDDADDDAPLTLHEGDRFWEVSIRETADAFEVLTRFGKTGAAGQTRVKTFDTLEDARAERERAVAEKRKQGFA